MTRRPAIVHLIGFPAAGKLTIAHAVADAAVDERFVVVDNHHTSNVIFEVVGVNGSGPIEQAIWDRVDDVREVVYRSIEELAPPDRSFVFTNVLTDDHPTAQRTIDRLAALAAARDSLYVPIRLFCDTAELLVRVDTDSRRQRMKWIAPAEVAAFVSNRRLFEVVGHDPFDLDVTALPPDYAASAILTEIDGRRNAAS